MEYFPVPLLFDLELKKKKKSCGAITSQSLYSPRLEFGWAFVYSTQLEVPLQPPMVVTQLNSVLGFPSVLVFSALVLLSLQPFRLLGSSQCQTLFNSVISTGPLTASSLGPLFLKLTDLIYFRGFKHQLHPSFGSLAICFSYLQTYLASDVATLMSLSILMYSKQAQIP